jgi:hypothetical protein
MKRLTCKKVLDEKGVSTTVEYITISGIIMVTLMILMLVMNSVFMQGPRDLVSYHSFVDIGNGVSTRIVDVYVIAPPPYLDAVKYGNIKTKYSIPDDVARASYSVDITGSRGTENIVVSRGAISSTSSLAGIGSTIGAGGSSSGMGMKVIDYCYNSAGGGCPP